ncbi:phage minor tail protein L [Budvicia aquatica]|uniref:Phage minor tail protein L n=1 Tax=Budvicia aquatica TaxID=82979 RepID=A0A2C6DLW1_9GAMM|nr:phage minor tail protein L [Budvicia aquatica]PHI29683.1 phage minor tail protein L [Budvicia aquatica]VFS48064.1 phage minor tail protein L [Budvicia aquatica]
MRDIDSELILSSAKIEQDVLLSLYELDLTHIGGDLFRFHDGVNELKQSIIWQGKAYQPYPIQAKGFEASGQGTSNRPTLTVANITGLVTGLMQDFDELVGAIITRHQMYMQYLDDENFVEGNPQADPTQELVSRYVIERMGSLTADFATFELALPCESDGALLPARTIIADTCSWLYRSAECGYTGPAVADEFDNPTKESDCDKCGRRLVSCKLRFGRSNPLPFGGFPSVSKFSK